MPERVRPPVYLLQPEPDSRYAGLDRPGPAWTDEPETDAVVDDVCQWRTSPPTLEHARRAAQILGDACQNATPWGHPICRVMGPGEEVGSVLRMPETAERVEDSGAGREATGEGSFFCSVMGPPERGVSGSVGWSESSRSGSQPSEDIGLIACRSRRCSSAGLGDVEAEGGVGGQAFGVHAVEDRDAAVDVVVELNAVLALMGS